MLFPRTLTALAASLALAICSHAAVEVKEGADKVRVEIDGKLLTEYCFKGASHVYFYPLLGPGGVKMTRSWPMEEVAGEEHDHPHHRSLWFAHGLVNGVDFWTEAASHGKKNAKFPVGKIEHEKFIEVKGGAESGVISDSLKWVAPDGSVPVTSVQTFRAYSGGEKERVIDYSVTLKAGEKEVVFGDTKEGTMAMRLNESMRLMLPGKKPGAGHMVNDSGVTDGDVWGKKAAWVDYSGPVDGKVVGVAIFDHPSNPRHPTRWHARDYGLFAANPFSEHDMDKSQPAGAGDFKLAAGQSVTFRYRIILHEGDAKQAKIADQFAAWTKSAN